MKLSTALIMVKINASRRAAYKHELLLIFRMALFILSRNEIQLMAALGHVVELVNDNLLRHFPFNLAFSEMGFLAGWVDECRFPFKLL